MRLPFGIEVSRRGHRASRKIPNMRTRGFAGAESGRLLSSWSTSPKSPNQVIYNDLVSLRARSRDSFHNNDFVRRFVGMVKSNVVGPRGVLLQAQALSVKTGNLDRGANEAIETAWKDWGFSENCDFDGRLSWVEMQRQAIASAAIDGEVLARLVMGKRGGKYGLMVRHLDPQSLDVKLNEPLSGGRQIKMGLELDADGRVVAYHLRDYSRAGSMRSTGGTYQRIPANQIIHAFLPEQVNQKRGYPWMSTALMRLKMLDGYYEAALVAARAGAAKMGFITSPDGEGYVGDDTDSDGAVISEFEAGIIEQLSDGESFQSFDPRYPHEQFPEFVKSCLQAISGSLGVSYTGLSGNLEGVNYSSIRAGVLEEREAWKALQEWFVESYCRPIYNAWLDMARLTGQITVGGQPLNGPDSKYRRVGWQPRRWSWVDPSRDMAANVNAIENNITTVSAVIRDQGRDPDEVFLERAAEKARMTDLGLIVADVLSPQPAGASNG